MSSRFWYKRDGYEGKELRKKPDWIKRAAGALCIAGWACVAFGISLFSDSMPVTTGFPKQFFGVATQSWNKQALFSSLVLFCISIALGVFGLICNLMRLKRKDDRIYISIIVLCIAGMLCTGYVLYNFSGIIFPV